MTDNEDTDRRGSDTDSAAPAATDLATRSAEDAQRSITDAADREDEAAASRAGNIEKSLELAEEERVERMKPAKIGAEDAQAFEASGAVIESGALKQVDVDHPAVDNNPRAGTTVRQNSIDFNDPTLTDRQAVEQRLSDQDGDFSKDD